MLPASRIQVTDFYGNVDECAHFPCPQTQLFVYGNVFRPTYTAIIRLSVKRFVK